METNMNIENKEVIERLARLQRDMDFLKEHIEDITLTDDDIKSIEEARKDLKEGRTTSLKDLKKELQI